MRIAATFWPEARHGTAQTLSPVTRPELFAIAGEALDKELTFWRRSLLGGIGHVVRWQKRH